MTYDDLAAKWLMPRLKTAHKGLYGHVLIIGGGQGMPGAVLMAAHGALRVGAGVVSVATWPDYARQSLPGLPEAMIHAIHDKEDLQPLIAKATVCVLGPGLGEDEWAQHLFLTVMKADKPKVIDASALHLLAKTPQKMPNDVVLTPHVGEAAALLQSTVAAVQANREDAARQLQTRYGGSVVLKGHQSVIIDASQQLDICYAGNPGMATAGMGDVLSGVIGGLMAQGIVAPDAIRLGVWIHAMAGDRAAAISGERGLLASDLMPFLHQLVNLEKTTL